MKNYVQEGDTMTFTAPVGGVVSSMAYKIGQILVVAASTVAAGQPFAGRVVGVFTLPKPSGQSWAEGAVLYWDNTAKNVTTTATSNLRIGCAAAAAASADVTGIVRLNGVAAPDGA